MISPRRTSELLDEACAEERREVRLFLRLPKPGCSREKPSRLALGLGLHLYSDILLGRRARIEMNFAAVVLVVVCLFELIAWSFLFNAIFNSNIFYLGVKTLPAVLVAMLFALAVLWFERQLLIHDEARKAESKRAARVRLLFIVLAALATAQPLELFFFRMPVLQRIHEEGIRQEAVRAFSEIGEVRLRMSEDFQRKTARGHSGVTELQSRLREETTRKAALDSELRKERGRESYWRTWVPGEGERNARGMSLNQARALSAAAARRSEALEEQVSLGATTIRALEADAGIVRKELKEFDTAFQAQNEQQDRRLREWIDQLQSSKPGNFNETSVLPVGRRWSYELPTYDFFEQLHIVWDLVCGRPSRWLKGTPQIRQTLERKYGFPPTDRGKGWQWHLFIAVLACHLVALYIPLLVVTIKKFLMPRELRNYYSSRHQAEAGDPDALLSWIVEERVHGRQALEIEADRDWTEL